MAESRESVVSSSDSDDEVSVSLGDKVVVEGAGCSDSELERREAQGTGGSSTNRVGDSSGTVERSLARANTLPGETFNADKLDIIPSHVKLERSKTERRKKPNILGEEVKRIFDDKISAEKKRKLLNRVATVNHDGTVEFEVSVDVETLNADVLESFHHEAVDEESLDPTDLQCVPPLQIVMLIVGTRGDVQPFVAIGKHLQAEFRPQEFQMVPRIMREEGAGASKTQGVEKGQRVTLFHCGDDADRTGQEGKLRCRGGAEFFLDAVKGEVQGQSGKGEEEACGFGEIPDLDPTKDEGVKRVEFRVPVKKGEGPTGRLVELRGGTA
ncbi:sterol 3-beta-glucosyltransferase UGT80A2-like [Telopea speciosissima]|uniref:sterol 3-beta-glucosyltransferase UGT80A2-like n=1 Tax=Telopea speciosissima TaxID=54955 RepID=UPI001CC60822|nr:sterol 3-beta-glucosyltransferase UGT80A2-like [Telopea speciosissima]